MTYTSNFTIQMAAILFWQILTLKLIFQLGKQFFQIQHIQLMKTKTAKSLLTRNASRSLFCRNMPSLYGFGFNNQYRSQFTFIFKICSVWIWIILITVTYMGRVSEMFQIKCVDIIISTFLLHWLDLVSLLLPNFKL